MNTECPPPVCLSGTSLLVRPSLLSQDVTCILAIITALSLSLYHQYITGVQCGCGGGTGGVHLQTQTMFVCPLYMEGITYMLHSCGTVPLFPKSSCWKLEKAVRL
jgi:hypothetical protein